MAAAVAAWSRKGNVARAGTEAAASRRGKERALAVETIRRGDGVEKVVRGTKYKYKKFVENIIFLVVTEARLAPQ